MRSVVFILSLVFLVGCKSDTKYKACEDYKTGVFEYDDEQFKDWKVIRTETNQIETNDSLGIIIESQIEWLSDCEFLLIYDQEKSSDIYAKMADTLRVEFLEIKDNSYVYRASGQNLDTKGEMIRVD